MVTDTETVQKTVYFPVDDYNFISSLHNDNFNEGLRIALRRARKNTRETMVIQYMQFVIFGIITLGIGSILNPNTSVSVFFLIMGFGLVIFGIYNIAMIVKRKRVKKL